VVPENSNNNASANERISVTFDKLMLASSLRPGETTITNPQGAKTKHKLLNLWSAANFPVGYWVTATDNYDPATQVGHTEARLNHTSFSAATNYRSQVGSGVKDIYQNCYKPSDGPNCNVNDVNPSCCYGVATSTLDAKGNCQ